MSNTTNIALPISTAQATSLQHWPCSCCARLLPVCNGDGSYEEGYTWAQCQGCADAYAGKLSPECFSSLNNIKCGITGAFKGSEHLSCKGYIRIVYSAMQDGYPQLAANYLLLAHGNRLVTLAMTAMAQGLTK